MIPYGVDKNQQRLQYETFGSSPVLKGFASPNPTAATNSPPSPQSYAVSMGKAADHYILRAQC